MSDIEGLLLDVDGVLVTSWKPLPGAVETISWLRDRAVPFRLLTNTTQFSQAGLAQMLIDVGFDLRPEELITASVATGAYLRAHHAGQRCFVLVSGAALEDLQGVHIVDGQEGADIVVIGDAEEDFTYGELNLAFRLLMDGALFIAMHRNMYWMARDGVRLDVGAFVAGLEAASRVPAIVMGKPSAQVYLSALVELGLPPERVAMVGDDVANDVLAAQEVGMTGVLVKTGKFRPQDLERADAMTRVIDSVADVRRLLS